MTYIKWTIFFFNVHNGILVETDIQADTSIRLSNHYLEDKKKL